MFRRRRNWRRLKCRRIQPNYKLGGITIAPIPISSSLVSWSNPGLICGFCIGVGFVLPERDSWSGIYWTTLIACLFLLCWGLRGLLKGEASKGATVSGVLAIGLVVVFGWLDPFMEMNADPVPFVWGSLLFGAGCVATAEAFRNQLGAVGFGTMSFWVCAAWVLHNNIVLIQWLPGKRGVGMWGYWVS